MVKIMATKTKKSGKSRSEKKAKRTRSKLKKAALNVFSEKSVDAATVEEITEKADLGKGTLYQHFDDKEEIVVTLVEEAIEHLIERIRSYDSAPDTLEGMLEHLLDAHYEFSVDSREEFLLLFQGKLLVKLQSETLDDLEEPYLRYLEEIENQLSTYLSPRIDPLKVRRLACAVAGFVFGFFSFAMIGMTEDEIENSVKPLRQTFVKSLRTFLGR
jgi:AcrR family transcriptional regulator